ncbi:DASH family cryptochrome [Arcticibacter eurypsychrophilus]|uniref:DASH family cryptochrome n=1 Tax=Arcticibacter eurypsychrophilus TaxID=1434752 RepID=UPI00084DC6BD|nr:DASH family cryptochrome [Arcticibacter eurypsychrophilus]
MTTSILWFKNDLRLEDNEALVEAIAQSDQLIPVYCFDEAIYKTIPYGFTRIGKFRAKFLLESLSELKFRLAELGANLQIVKGNPEEELPKIAFKYNAKKVFTEREIAFEELQTLDKVRSALLKNDCFLMTSASNTLYHIDDLPLSIDRIPDIFSQFRVLVEKKTTIRPALNIPHHIPTPDLGSMDIPTLAEMGLPAVERDARAVLNYKGGESEAIKRLKYYFQESKAISRYKETRNGMVGSDFSTKFSAWLSMGCLSSRYIYSELKAFEDTFGANESTYWLQFELLWRDYFKLMMEKYGNKLFLFNGIKARREKPDAVNFTILQQWINGETGVDFVDANMKELKFTGYMSNRGRQNVASFLINDLQIDWRYGAAYFEQQLIDYDVSSNWGNWAYLSGVGNDPRGKRYFNIEKQANDYDQDKKYRNLWLNL